MCRLLKCKLISKPQTCHIRTIQTYSHTYTNTHVFTCTRMCDSPHKPVNFYACMYVCSPVLSCSTAIVPLHPCRANFSFADFFSIFYRILFLCVCFFFCFLLLSKTRVECQLISVCHFRLLLRFSFHLIPMPCGLVVFLWKMSKIKLKWRSSLWRKRTNIFRRSVKYLWRTGRKVISFITHCFWLLELHSGCGAPSD